MADIAELGFVAHDDALKRAEERLLKLPPAAAKAEAATDKFNRSADEGRSKVDRLSSGLGNVTAVLLRFAGGIAAAFSVSMLSNYADAWSDMQSRVGAAIKDMEAAPVLMQRLVDIANASYSPLSQTVEIFGRNVAVLGDLGRSASEAADFTESLNNMLVITATRGERAESVQNALSKAMAVGKLQADGLETVLANGGRVAEALAAELGTTVSGLRAFASEGKITGDVIARAIIKPLADVREEAARMPATITDAFTILNNNVTQAIGTLDKASGASAAVAEVIMTLANNLGLVGAGLGGVAAVIVTALIPSFVAATVAMWAFTVAALANPLTWVVIAVGAVVTGIILLVQHLGGLSNAFQHVQMIAMGVWERIKAGAASLDQAISGTALKIQASFAGAFAGVMSGWDALVQKLGPGAGLIGISAEGTSAYVKQLTADAEGLDAAATAAFASAGKFWETASGGGIKANIIEQGAGSFSAFAAEMGVVTDSAAGAGNAIAGIGSAAGAANDNVKDLSASTGYLDEAQRKLNEQYQFGKSTLGSFFSTFKQELMAGTSLWDSFGQAAVNVLDNIANKAMEMASNNIWDMIFGAIGGNFIGGSAGAAPLQLGFQKGIPGFVSGGYTGSGPTSGVAGAVHGQEFVMNAAATQRIGVGNLNAMNDNMPVDLGGSSGDTYVVNFNPQQNISGMGLTMEQAQELIRISNTQMLDELPDVINGIQADPRKRKVRAG
jgi:tape measure domain-containing protein